MSKKQLSFERYFSLVTDHRALIIVLYLSFGRQTTFYFSNVFLSWDRARLKIILRDAQSRRRANRSRETASGSKGRVVRSWVRDLRSRERANWSRRRDIRSREKDARGITSLIALKSYRRQHNRRLRGPSYFSTYIRCTF